MSRNMLEVERELESLSPEEQEILVQRFFDRQSRMEVSVKASWIEDADKRLDELLTGEVEGIDAEEVFGEMQRIVDQKD